MSNISKNIGQNQEPNLESISYTLEALRSYTTVSAVENSLFESLRAIAQMTAGPRSHKPTIETVAAPSSPFLRRTRKYVSGISLKFPTKGADVTRARHERDKRATHWLRSTREGDGNSPTPSESLLTAGTRSSDFGTRPKIRFAGRIDTKR